MLDKRVGLIGNSPILRDYSETMNQLTNLQEHLLKCDHREEGENCSNKEESFSTIDQPDDGSSAGSLIASSLHTSERPKERVVAVVNTGTPFDDIE